MNKLKLLFLLCGLIFLFNGCAIFGGGKKPVALELRYDQNAYINYGYSFNLEAVLIYNNGKEKEVTTKDETEIKVEGAYYSYGRITIDKYPRKLSSNLIRVHATYKKDEVNFVQDIEIPFNYKGEIELDFRGKQGSTGIQGENGGTALLFRDGKDGGTGGIGGDGFTGDNLTVYVWKDSGDFYFIKVNNLTTSVSYMYKMKSSGYPFRLNVSGGQGGSGGDGGSGGEGKDGSNNNNKIKLPGNGGRGGMGGVGGTGGKGGNVYVFIHPNAEDFRQKISCYNYGGPGGYGGKGGSGGRGGRPLEGQTAGTNGGDGTPGQRGYDGAPGDVFSVLVEEFDIEY
ncbi:MAG: hypothetical protein IPM74_05490 [Crocinitomicaceae bacterium]|nr:hypothetical protein [Crocinitomicaceae bacterium]MBK8925357.1 hypothetical protein [Crocinitomicaceae bacterium]